MDTAELKKFTGQKEKFVAFTQEIKEADQLLAEGWKLFSVQSIPAMNQFNQPVILNAFILTKEIGFPI